MATTGHLQDARNAFTEIEAATGIWVSSHDMRRGFVTTAESLPLPPLAAKALFNHGLGKGVHEGYARLTVEHLRGPMQMITDRLISQCGIGPPAKVARIRIAAE